MTADGEKEVQRLALTHLFLDGSDLAVVRFAEIERSVAFARLGQMTDTFRLLEAKSSAVDINIGQIEDMARDMKIVGGRILGGTGHEKVAECDQEPTVRLGNTQITTCYPRSLNCVRQV